MKPKEQFQNGVLTMLVGYLVQGLAYGLVTFWLHCKIELHSAKKKIWKFLQPVKKLPGKPAVIWSRLNIQMTQNI